MSLEEDLQSQLDSSWDIALAMALAKVTVAVVRQPELVHGAKENPVKHVACVGLEPDVPVLTEVGVLIERKVLVAIPETTDIFIHAGCVAESKGIGATSRCAPSRLIEVGDIVRVA